MLYLPGLQNVVADFLSRPSPLPKPTGDVATTAVTMPIDFAQMAAKQNLCPEIQRLLGGSSLTIPFQQAGIHHLVGKVFNRCYSSGGTGKIQERHFFHLHNISHPGRLASHCLVSSRYV
jgi:hypothetical protein